jgi:hypothetical protein
MVPTTPRPAASTSKGLIAPRSGEAAQENHAISGEAEVAYRPGGKRNARQRYKGWRDEPRPRETTMDPTAPPVKRADRRRIEADRVHHAQATTRPNLGGNQQNAAPPNIDI